MPVSILFEQKKNRTAKIYSDELLKSALRALGTPTIADNGFDSKVAADKFDACVYTLMSKNVQEPEDTHTHTRAYTSVMCA